MAQEDLKSVSAGRPAYKMKLLRKLVAKHAQIQHCKEFHTSGQTLNSPGFGCCSMDATLTIHKLTRIGRLTAKSEGFQIAALKDQT